MAERDAGICKRLCFTVPPLPYLLLNYDKKKQKYNKYFFFYICFDRKNYGVDRLK